VFGEQGKGSLRDEPGEGAKARRQERMRKLKGGEAEASLRSFPRLLGFLPLEITEI
jgi:hypothetical protein